MIGMSPDFPEGLELDNSPNLLFPNPFDDRVQGRIGAGSELPGQLQVTNVQEAVLKLVPITAGDHEFNPDLQGLLSGVYCTCC